MGNGWTLSRILSGGDHFVRLDSFTKNKESRKTVRIRFTDFYISKKL